MVVISRAHIGLRCFEELSVPDIVKKVFEDHGVANFEFKLFRHYRKRTYCVQYRESDYNFIARLLGHEGIYWYFEHGDGDELEAQSLRAFGDRDRPRRSRARWLGRSCP